MGTAYIVLGDKLIYIEFSGLSNFLHMFEFLIFAIAFLLVTIIECIV